MQIVGLADESTVADRGKLDMKLRCQMPNARSSDAQKHDGQTCRTDASLTIEARTLIRLLTLVEDLSVSSPGITL